MENNKHLINAPYWKRLLSYAIDMVLSIGIGFILYTFVTSNFLYTNLGGFEAEQNLCRYSDESGLVSVKKNDDGTYNKSGPSIYQYKASDADTSSNYVDPPNGKQAYEAYYDMVYDYYTVKLPQALSSSDSDYIVLKDGDGKEFTSVDDYKKYFNQTIFSLPALEDLSKIDEANRSSQSNSYFCLALNEAGDAVDPLAKPVLKSEYAAKVAASDADTLKTLRNFFYDSTAKDTTSVGKYYDAVLDMTGSSSTSVQTYYKTQTSLITSAQAVCQVVAFIPMIFVFFFIIPAALPYGKSLGKLIFNTPVVTQEGLSLNVTKRILRPFYMAMTTSLLFVPYQIALFAFFILFIVDALMLGFSKNGTSLHDRLFKTLVLDGKNSIYFKNIEERESYYEEHPEECESEEQKEIDYALEAAIKDQERVLNLETIAKSREEARSITSFDEFEAKKEKEIEALKAKNEQNAVNLTKDDTPSEQ